MEGEEDSLGSEQAAENGRIGGGEGKGLYDLVSGATGAVARQIFKTPMELFLIFGSLARGLADWLWACLWAAECRPTADYRRVLIEILCEISEWQRRALPSFVFCR